MSDKMTRVKLFFQISGFRGLLFHYISRLSPPNRFSRQATLRDFKIHGLKFVDDVWQMLSSINVEFSTEQAKQIQSEFSTFAEQQRLEIPEEKFPNNWNSGESLRLLLFAFIRLMKPDHVVEMGTANGYSTSAIAYAFELNGKGRVHTFDILDSSAPYVLPTSRAYVELHLIAEDPDALLTTLQSLDLDTIRGFYFHDADHSYFGQYHDFEIARKVGFNHYISDDVETSLVFCEKAEKKNSSILFDGRKFIGVSLISKS